jgi:carboxymethylenebutenolidase
LARDLTDPQYATAAEFSRSGFVRLGTGAAFTIANGAAAAAQTEGFGKPHPPIVPEDDPAILIERPRLQPAAGSAIGAYAATPRTLTRRTPGVVVIQAIWGVDAQLRDVVRRYAKSGYMAIAPALFDRLNPPSGDGSIDYADFAPLAAQMNAQGFVPTDILAAHDWLRTHVTNASVGVTGFCMGGGLTLQAIIDSKAFAAASMFYGDVRPGTGRNEPAAGSAFDFTSRITTPLLGSFGARDTSIKAEDVHAMFARLRPPHAVKIYDEAGHAFFDDTRQSYVPSAAADSWTRTLAWFGRYLA